MRFHGQYVAVNEHCIGVNNKIIIKRQFILHNNMARVTTIRAPYNVRCSYSAKQLVSEVRMWEKMMCLEHVFERRNERAVGDCSGRPDQPHKMPSCINENSTHGQKSRGRGRARCTRASVECTRQCSCVAGSECASSEMRRLKTMMTICWMMEMNWLSIATGGDLAVWPQNYSITRHTK